MSCYDDCEREGRDAYRYDRYSHETRERLDAGRYQSIGECNREFTDGYRREERRAEEREAEREAEEAAAQRRSSERQIEEDEYWEQMVEQRESPEDQRADAFPEEAQASVDSGIEMERRATEGECI